MQGQACIAEIEYDVPNLESLGSATGVPTKFLPF